MADVNAQDIPVDVVPDNLMQGFQRANVLSQLIGQHRAGQQLPFAGGTPTLAAKEFSHTQEQDQQYMDLKNREMALSEMETQYDVSKPYYKTSSSSGSSTTGSGTGSQTNLTQTDRYNQANGEALKGVADAVNTGLTYDDIKQNILSSAGELKAAGVNVDDVISYLDKMYPQDRKMQEELAMMEQQAADDKQQLKDRPWYQKVVDILPGEQFR